MKTSTVVTVMAIFLMLIAGVGFGIAQAGGTHTDSSAYGLADQDSLQVVNAPEEDMDEQPIFIANAPEEDMDEPPIFIANAPEEDMDEPPTFVANALGEDMELQEPIGVGTLPSGSNMDIDDTDSHDQAEYTGKN